MHKKLSLIFAGTAVIAAAAIAAPAFAQGPMGFGHGPVRAPFVGNGIFGTVTAISGNTITVKSFGRPMPANSSATATTYTVDASQATVTKNGAASSVSAIAVNDMIMVQGTINGTNVTATKIEDGFMGGPGFGRGIFGKVTAISGNTITVSVTMGPKISTTSTTYTVDATNAKVTKNGTASSVSAIAVNDMISVQGTVSGTNVTATSINDGMLLPRPTPPINPLITGNGEPVIAGTISAINGNTLTVTNKSNITYTVDATNATVTKGNAKSTLSSVAVNDNVVIQGTVNGTNVTAASVIDSGASATDNGKGTGQEMHQFFGSIGNFFKKLFGF